MFVRLEGRPARKPNRDLAPCASCGTTIRPGKRKTPHEDTAECLVKRTFNFWRARGYLPVDNPTARILEATGVGLIEDWAKVEDVYTHKELVERKIRSRDRPPPEARKGFYAPEQALVGVRLVRRLGLSAVERRAAVKMFNERPEAREALEAYERLRPKTRIEALSKREAQLHGHEERVVLSVRTGFVRAMLKERGAA